MTTEQKIIAYLKASYGEKKPRLTTKEVVEYANKKGANWTIENWSEEKYTKAGGNTYFTGGGSREYNGYRVRHNGVNIYTSTETYRTIKDLLRQLPNYEKLNKIVYAD